MKIKNILLSAVSFVLVAALAIGGTLAYLQAEDSDVNVMTLGNVKIAQHEYQRAEGVAHNAGESGKGNGVKEGALVPYVQGQKLYPAFPKNNTSTDYSAEATDLFFWGDYVYSGTAGNGLWNDDNLSNVMDKMVFVENTGKTAAYVRTIIAFECPEGMSYGEGPFVDECEFMMNVNGSATYAWEEIGYITVNDARYLVMEATYANVLNPGAQAHPSLLQVVMTHNATNEDMALLGDTYEILVVSQAVQAAGFANAETALDAAFGDITTTNHPWAEGVKVPEVVDKDNIDDALENGDDVIFDDDIEKPADNSNGYGKTSITVYKGQVIDGANNVFEAIGANGTWDTAINAYGGTVKNLTIAKGFRGLFINHITGDNGEKCGLVTLENVTIDGCTYTISCDQGTNSGLKATNCTFNGWTSYAKTTGNVEFTDCNFGEGNGYSFCRPFAPTTFVGCDFEAGYEMDPRAAVTFENCTIGGAPLTAENLGTLVIANIANATVK